MTAGSGRGLFDVCFTSFCDWPQNSCHFLNQSDIKGKPITSWLRMFSRAWGSQVGFTLSSHWLLKFYLPFFWLAVDIILVLVLRHWIEKRSIYSFVNLFSNACILRVYLFIYFLAYFFVFLFMNIWISGWILRKIWLS